MATHVQDVCEDCSSGMVQAIQYVLSFFGVVFTLLLLFGTGWRHVFPDNWLHSLYDKGKEKFFEGIAFGIRTFGSWRKNKKLIKKFGN